ncbi:uncharacterized protein LOC143221543 [Lasioglossum baleicum]|uniref:uncharacterized protein LOC143221543 n=1 Tax=Lasioglossum baleicum TaxID=434251 RepID=UPI003FCCCB43
MSISAPKCTAFPVVPTKGSYFVKDPGLFFSGGERVPYASAETRNRYLGISFTPWTGIDLGAEDSRSWRLYAFSSSLKSGLSFLNNPDPAIQAFARATGLEAKLRSQARAARLNWPVASVKQVDKWKADAKKRELQLWGECTAQGKAVHNYKNDRIGNAWLYNPTLLKPSRFLTALRLRTDTAGNRVAINRATPLPVAVL